VGAACDYVTETKGIADRWQGSYKFYIIETKTVNLSHGGEGHRKKGVKNGAKLH